MGKPSIIIKTAIILSTCTAAITYSALIAMLSCFTYHLPPNSGMSIAIFVLIFGTGIAVCDIADDIGTILQ